MSPRSGELGARALLAWLQEFFIRQVQRTALNKGGRMLKQAVGFLASFAAIAGLALLIGVLVRLSWDAKIGYPAASPEPGAPRADEVLREA